MAVDDPEQAPERGVIPHPEQYVMPMTKELSCQVADAVDNSWRVDLYKDSPPAPEESSLSLGLTQEEVTWLKKLMKRPSSRSKARAIDQAAYVQSLDVTSARLREYDRRLLEILTPRQFYQEVDAFFGSGNDSSEQDAEVDLHAQDDADEICLIDTDRTSLHDKLQISTIDSRGATSPFHHDLEQHLAGDVGEGQEEMNLDGFLEVSQDSAVGADEGYSGHDVQMQYESADSVTPQAVYNELSMDDTKPEYETPDCVNNPSPPPQVYTSGPFTMNTIGTFPHAAPEPELLAHQANQSEFGQGEFGPAMPSLQISDQAIDIVTTGDNTVSNTHTSADLQLEAELNASTKGNDTDSPGPYTSLLKSTDDYNMPAAHDMHFPELRMQELALGEHIYTNINRQQNPNLHRTRTPSPLKTCRQLTPTTPTTLTFPPDRTTPTPTLRPLRRIRPRPLTQPITIHNQRSPRTTTSPSPTPSPPPTTPTRPRPQTPKEKSVKAIFASPKLGSGPPSPPTKATLDRATPTTTPPGRTCADHHPLQPVGGVGLGIGIGYKDVDEGDTVRVQLPVSVSVSVSVSGGMRGFGAGLGLVLMPPDSAVDVSFPGVEEEEEQKEAQIVRAEAEAESVIVVGVSGKTKAATTSTAKAKAKAMAKTTTPKKKVGRPRKVRTAVGSEGIGLGLGLDVGGGGGGRGGRIAKAPPKKRARKGTRAPVGGGAI